VATAQGLHFQARCVVIAAGVGAFEPRRLAPEAFKALHGQQVFFAGQDPAVFAGLHCLVVGGDASAIEAALQLCKLSASGAPTPVGLMHRRDVWDAEPALIERMRQCVAQGQMQLLIGQPLGPQLQDGHMKAMNWVNSAGETQTLTCDAVWVQLGLSPQLGALAQWGLAMQRKQLAVDSASFATSVPGIFAVGDVNTYPGKQKLILCGFHEATLAAFAIAARLRPGERTTLQYTTTSTHLHRLLGVDGR
jgi:thioredoxin reductase (NADPH)